ncbi:hypothetical protein ACFGOO_06570 [Treponema vincentii]|uniref:hypothetical protein n=1 Tax=Treponema vincentii TaxID=69710 RepID=UPI0035F5C388
MAQDIENTLNTAIDGCIEKGILSDYLERKREDVIEMLKLEFAYEEDVRTQRAEAEKIGFDKGLEEGIKETKRKTAKNLLELGVTVEVIAKVTGLSVQNIETL